MHYMKRELFWKGFEVLRRNIALRKFQPNGRILLDKLRMCRWNYQPSVKQRTWPIVQIDMSCVSTHWHAPWSCQQLLSLYVLPPKRTSCPRYTAYIFQFTLHWYKQFHLQVLMQKDDFYKHKLTSNMCVLAESVRRQGGSSSSILALWKKNLLYSNMTVYINNNSPMAYYN